MPVYDLKQTLDNIIRSCLKARDEGYDFGVLFETNVYDSHEVCHVFSRFMPFNTFEDLCSGSFSEAMRSSNDSRSFVLKIIDINSDLAEQLVAQKEVTDASNAIRQKVDIYLDTLESVSSAERRLDSITYGLRKLFNRPPKDEAELQDLTLSPYRLLS